MFWSRFFSGMILMLIASLGFFFGTPVLTIILFATSMVAYRELTKALGISAREDGKKFSAPEVVGYLATIGLYVSLALIDLGLIERSAAGCLLGVIVILFIAELFVYVLCFPRFQAEQIGFSVFAFFYAPVMLSFVELTRAAEGGEFLVWVILISSWGCDTFAYIVGKLIGKKKIFPVLSPKKSLEGCIGGVVGTIVLGTVYGLLVADYTGLVPVEFALICALGAVVSMVGDLAASAIKRNKGIKDYGKLIPGHGGIMDRLDSVIVTAPIIYSLIAVLV
ncbi:MAG: phosphatidate cytidylyltransferase [Acetatifactor sp.]